VFAGLVIVAIAGNAIENFVGIQLAYRNQPDYAVSVIMNSSLQIALGLFPLLVLLSFFLGGAILSFVLSPMLLVSLALAVIVSAFVVFDGESIWLEGLALIGLYCLIAAAFWVGDDADPYRFYKQKLICVSPALLSTLLFTFVTDWKRKQCPKKFATKCHPEHK
jgi:hypothetical protein